MKQAIYVGVDVSKKQLDVAIRPLGQVFGVSNDRRGIAQLVKRLKKLQAIGVMNRIHIRRARLLGLDAPTKLDIGAFYAHGASQLSDERMARQAVLAPGGKVSRTPVSLDCYMGEILQIEIAPSIFILDA